MKSSIDDCTNGESTDTAVGSSGSTKFSSVSHGSNMSLHTIARILFGAEEVVLNTLIPDIRLTRENAT